jgi:hypothetical protein
MGDPLHDIQPEASVAMCSSCAVTGAVSPSNTHTNAASALGRIHPPKPSAMLGVGVDAGSRAMRVCLLL